MIPKPKKSRIQKTEKKVAVKPSKIGHPMRRPEENVPSYDYIKRIEKLGPRTGESRLSFLVRIEMIKATRSILMKEAEIAKGNLSDVCRKLGIVRQNLRHHLGIAGLTSSDLILYGKGSEN